MANPRPAKKARKHPDTVRMDFLLENALIGRPYKYDEWISNRDELELYVDAAMKAQEKGGGKR